MFEYLEDEALWLVMLWCEYVCYLLRDIVIDGGYLYLDWMSFYSKY